MSGPEHIDVTRERTTMKKVVATIALALMSLLAGSAAWADPVPVSATIHYFRASALELTFFSPFRAGLSVGTDTEPWRPPHSTHPAEGSLLNLSASEPILRGFFDVGANSYTAEASFTIAAGSVVVPIFSRESVFVRSTPFQFSGTMNGVSQSGARRQLTLVGSGTAEVFLAPSATPGFADWYSTFYTFNELSATPEPPTWLLMGTALGIIARRLRKRAA